MSSTLFVKFLSAGLVVPGGYAVYSSGMFGGEFAHESTDLDDSLASLAYIHMPDDEEGEPIDAELADETEAEKQRQLQEETERKQREEEERIAKEKAEAEAEAKRQEEEAERVRAEEEAQREKLAREAAEKERIAREEAEAKAKLEAEEKAKREREEQEQKAKLAREEAERKQREEQERREREEKERRAAEEARIKKQQEEERLARERQQREAEEAAKRQRLEEEERAKAAAAAAAAAKAASANKGVRGDGVPQEDAMGVHLGGAEIIQGESEGPKITGQSAIEKAFGSSQARQFAEHLKQYSSNSRTNGYKIYKQLERLENCSGLPFLGICGQNSVGIKKDTNDMLKLLKGKMDGSNETYEHKFSLNLKDVSPESMFKKLGVPGK